MATKAIFAEGEKVGYMFREGRSFEGDSGWRFFTGNESLDFVDVKSNIEIYDVKQIMELDSSIESYLELPVGTELERAEGNTKFEAVKK